MSSNKAAVTFGEACEAKVGTRQAVSLMHAAFLFLFDKFFQGITLGSSTSSAVGCPRPA